MKSRSTQIIKEIDLILMTNFQVFMKSARKKSKNSSMEKSMNFSKIKFLNTLILMVIFKMKIVVKLQELLKNCLII